MKPRIVKAGDSWICRSRFYGIVGHLHTAWGYGDTPKEAYEHWTQHWGVKRYGK